MVLVENVGLYVSPVGFLRSMPCCMQFWFPTMYSSNWSNWSFFKTILAVVLLNLARHFLRKSFRISQRFVTFLLQHLSEWSFKRVQGPTLMSKWGWNLTKREIVFCQEPIRTKNILLICFLHFFLWGDLLFGFGPFVDFWRFSLDASNGTGIFAYIDPINKKNIHGSVNIPDSSHSALLWDL